MVKCHQLVKRPRVSAWICTPRRLKYIISCTVFGVIIGLIHTAERNTSLACIYNLQASIGAMLDLELRDSPKPEKSDRWKETSVKRGHIYSAYLDTRPEQVLEERHAVNDNETTWAMIRIIAILDIDMTDRPLSCIYKYKVNESIGNEASFTLATRRATRVKPVAVRENFGLRYTTFFILCDLTISNEINYDGFYNDKHLPYEITIAPIDLTDFDQLRHESFVPVLYPENGISTAEYSNNFMAVCVQMLHHNYDRVMNLVEFIEYYQMMGVDHFTFYNRSISSRVSKVLEYYKNKGIVTVLSWELPPYFIFEKTLRVDGIFAALNDCLYRSSFHKSYMYVAGVDVDEFIVPRKHDNFSSMMQYLDPIGPDRSLNPRASFLFRNMFFYSMLEDDPVTLPPDIPKLCTHSKTTRWTVVNPAGSRSKFIVRSRQTVELGNHRTWELRRTASAFGRRYEEVEVDPEVGASQHYRTCETYEEICWRRPTVRDRSAHRFTTVLGNRVAEVCENIFENGCPTGEKKNQRRV